MNEVPQKFEWRRGTNYFSGVITTPRQLPVNSVFVFGSNEAGKHGAGAAYTAYKEFAYPMGMPFGLYTGRVSGYMAFGIPTKDYNIKEVSLKVVDHYVQRFLSIARQTTQLTYFVTQIGCGLAGFSPEQIAPLFTNYPDNVVLDKIFYDILDSN